MALKALLFLLTTFIVVTTRVSSNDEELGTKAVYVKIGEKAPSHAPPPPPPKAPLSPVRSKKDCIPLCDQRCQLHSRKRPCMRACMTCCDRCMCVPPGTFGNREKCGKCYTDVTGRGNRSYQCP